MTQKVLSGGRLNFYKPYFWDSREEVLFGNQDPGTVLCKLSETGTLRGPGLEGTGPRGENRKGGGTSEISKFPESPPILLIDGRLVHAGLPLPEERKNNAMDISMGMNFRG